MAGREIGVECDRLAEEAQRGLVFCRSVFVKMPKTALIGFPGVEALRRLTQCTLLLRLGQGWFDDPGDARGNLVLHRENIAEIAFVTIGPDMRAREGIDQLRGDAH